MWLPLNDIWIIRPWYIVKYLTPVFTVLLSEKKEEERCSEVSSEEIKIGIYRYRYKSNCKDKLYIMIFPF